MGEIINNVKCNFIECRLDNTDSNNNLILIKPKFLPTPQTKLNYNNNSSQTVTKKSPPKEKGSGAKGALKRETVETASSALSNPSVLPEPVLANADSGATGTYLRLADIKVLRDVKMSSPIDQITVAVAEGTLIKSTHYGFLDVPGHGAMIAHIFPQLSGSLLSISQLVNLGLHASYCSNFVTFYDRDNKDVFQGNRDLRTGLWMVDLRSLSTGTASGAHLSASAAIRLDSVVDFVNFWHAAFGSPAVSTFLSAIENSFIKVPGLTATKVRRHPPNAVATAYGHLHATRQGIKSTKKIPAPILPSESISDESSEPTAERPEQRLWCRVHDVRGRAHSDATGALPVRGRSGALYQIVFFHEDSNFIHIEVSKSRKGPDLLASLQRAIKFFTARGVPPLIIRMDNECAKDTKSWLATTPTQLELTPVSQHRTNKAERAIGTWKDHFIATLATVDPKCPLSLWEDFVEQAELTLNLMRMSPIHPSLSAWEALCGKFDILATPIAPLGMKVLVHDTPDKRGTWQVHGKLGYYIGRALFHYRCHTVYMEESRATRVSDCLAWFPVTVKMPGSSPIEELTAAVESVKRILNKLLSTEAGSNSRQPLQEAEATLAEQLSTIRQLFQPNPPDAHEQRVEQQLPPDTWPRGQQLQPLQQHQLLLQTPPAGIAPALPLHTAPFQRVPVPLQRVPTTNNNNSNNNNSPNTKVSPIVIPATTHKAVQPTTNNNSPTTHVSPIVISTRSLNLPPKRFNKHTYHELTPSEIHKIPKTKFKCVGMQFTDDSDPRDTATGVMTSIVRHKKS